jgi:hypothetical protein
MVYGRICKKKYLTYVCGSDRNIRPSVTRHGRVTSGQIFRSEPQNMTDITNLFCYQFLCPVCIFWTDRKKLKVLGRNVDHNEKMHSNVVSFPLCFLNQQKDIKTFLAEILLKLLWDDVLNTVLIFWDKNWPCHRDDLIYIGKHSIVWNYNVWSLDITCTIDFYKTDQNHAPWFNIGTPQGRNHVPWMMS